MNHQSPVIKKITKKEFNLFQEEFRKYQKLLNLQDYKIGFKCEWIDGNFGTITTNSEDRTAWVTLTDKIHVINLQYFDVKKVARHEVLHLLLSDITYLACERFGNLDTIRKEEEKLVKILEKFIE